MVKLNFLASIAVACMCNDESFQEVVHIRTLAALSKGSTKCTHHGHLCSSMDKNITRYVRQVCSEINFERSVNTKSCQIKHIHGSENPFACKRIPDKGTYA